MTTDRPTIVCFHHAGGTASAFRDWQRHAGTEVNIRAVQLPGRESRIAEARHSDLGTLVETLVHELNFLLAGPHVLFGHSMGALVAYHLARRRLELGLRKPEALAVAAYAAPHLANVSIAVEAVSDLDLARYLCDIDGMRPELVRRPEWLGPLLAVVKDDLRVCHSHRYTPASPLPFPVHAFGGVDDPLVTEENLAGWRAHTSVEFSLTMVRGGHFLVTGGSEALREGVFSLARTHARATSAEQSTGALVTTRGRGSGTSSDSGLLGGSMTRPEGTTTTP
jgi:surfactin synthase thioesterase subunit